MGQHASKGSFEYRYVGDGECFKSKLLLINPPNFVTAHAAQDNPTRILRSVALQKVLWDGGRLLPEQWMHVLGNQQSAIFFVSWRLLTLSSGNEVYVLPRVEEVQERFEDARRKLASASPDAMLILVLWENDQDGYDEVPEDEAATLTSRTEKENTRDAASGDANDERAEDAAEDDDDEAPQVDESAEFTANNDRTIEFLPNLASTSGCQLFRIQSPKDVFALGCLLSMRLMPTEIGRPLCGLLYQLRDACSATEAFLIDGVTMHPLLSTLDTDPDSLDHYLHETLWTMRTSLRRIMRAFDTDLHIMVLPCASARMKIVVGWACRPYAYVLLLVPDTAASQLLIEKNMETVSMHFYNVINNTTTSRTYTPIVEL